MVYLIHFDAPYKHARHYLGYADQLALRLLDHKMKRGARLMAVIEEAGISWRLAKTWDGGRTTERRLKDQHHGPRLCPICRASNGA